VLLPLAVHSPLLTLPVLPTTCPAVVLELQSGGLFGGDIIGTVQVRWMLISTPCIGLCSQHLQLPMTTCPFVRVWYGPAKAQHPATLPSTG